MSVSKFVKPEHKKFVQEVYDPLYIREILVDLGFKNILDNGDYWRAPAIYRNGDAVSFSINKRSGWWRDFKTNQTGPLKLLPGLFGTQGNEIGIKKGDITFYKPEIKPPETFWEPTVLKKLLPYFDFFKQRGISEKTLLLFRAGYSRGNDLKSRIVFPIFHSNQKIHGFLGRDTTGKSPIKWKIIGRKSNFVYPARTIKESDDAIRNTKEVFCVESIGDALSMWENGIKNVLVFFGTDINQEIINYLVSVNPSKINICLNNDFESGIGNRASVKSLVKLTPFFDIGKLRINLPVKNDFGDHNKEDYEEWAAKSDNTLELVKTYLETKPFLLDREQKLLRML